MKFKCKVITRSSRNEILGIDNLGKLDLDFADEKDRENNLPFLKIYLTAAPIQGKANKELIKLLAGKLSVSKSKIKIVKGEKSKEKIIEIL
ncbi:MAG: DUF167 domain-containing protein [Patescibacteria group bacterium]|nr:DUF167 domain-containing protein [Patescibacteria group bacterium]